MFIVVLGWFSSLDPVIFHFTHSINNAVVCSGLASVKIQILFILQLMRMD